jgi:hypothetical protein
VGALKYFSVDRVARRVFIVSVNRHNPFKWKANRIEVLLRCLKPIG